MTTSVAEYVSLVIPTRNRPDFVARLLRYYAKTGFAGVIYIGDSSESTKGELVEQAIGTYQKHLRIEYARYPGLSEPATSEQLIGQVRSPYVAWIADDDFLVPETLVKCAAFLEEHSDYSIVHGRGIILSVTGGGATGSVDWTRSYCLPEVHEATASQRLLWHLRHYAVAAFCVQRTEQMQEAYQGNARLPDKSFTELLPCCLSIIQGKAHQLEGLYVVRQEHPRRYLLPDAYDWITSAGWLPSYEMFRDRLARAIVKADHVTLEQADAVVKEAFWSYLAKFVGENFDGHGARVQQERWRKLRQRLRDVPGLRGAWRWVRRVAPGLLDPLALPMLLRAASAHRVAFLPVHQAIQEPLTFGTEQELREVLPAQASGAGLIT